MGSKHIQKKTYLVISKNSILLPTPTKPRKRVFQINDSNIQQVLFCDNSDTEDALRLDDADVGFLEKKTV